MWVVNCNYCIDWLVAKSGRFLIRVQCSRKLKVTDISKCTSILHKPTPIQLFACCSFQEKKSWGFMITKQLSLLAVTKKKIIKKNICLAIEGKGVIHMKNRHAGKWDNYVWTWRLLCLILIYEFCASTPTLQHNATIRVLR